MSTPITRPPLRDSSESNPPPPNPRSSTRSPARGASISIASRAMGALMRSSQGATSKRPIAPDGRANWRARNLWTGGKPQAAAVFSVEARWMSSIAAPSAPSNSSGDIWWRRSSSRARLKLAIMPRFFASSAQASGRE